ncbi:MAG: long-chain-acyl-CoA synthetase [Myxococcota bacterium]
MTAPDRLRTLWTELRAVARVAPHLPRVRPGAPWSPARLLEERARELGGRPALLFEDRRYSWAEVDREVDRAAEAFRRMGVREGDVVALLMDNRPEFLFAATALNRIRAGGALINTNITGGALAHAIRIAEPVAVLVGSEHREKLAPVLPELTALSEKQVFVQADGSEVPTGAFPSFDELLRATSPGVTGDRPEPRSDDRFGYIYTSGTTGLPKAALITNRRMMVPGVVVGRGVFELTPDDVVYITTPLYHTVGIVVGWGGALTSGATMALRRKFSASRFWDDVRRFDATVFVYIGELCRYLLNQPASPDDRDHRLRIAGGNGLRPDIWEAFQSRFRIPLIREYYGATEGASMTINFTGKAGMVGRLMPGNHVIRCDVETGEPWRDAAGRCQALGPGGTGLLVSRITRAIPFDGYADRDATKKKVLEDVFKPGDRYFNTGDLLTLHEDGWLSFADRVGDTFRWKGENVSTNEVAEILNGAPGVLETNVYGVTVPGSDGRAGMASVNHDESFSIDAFAAYVARELPGYMRPYFVRLQHEMRITVTFKHQKVDYRREGYDPARVSDPLYFLDGERYVPLDAERFARIQDGSLKLR